MAPGVTTLTNVPNIADVHVMGKVLKNIGARIDVVNEHELRIDTSDVDSWETPYHLVAQMRASTAVLGPAALALRARDRGDARRLQHRRAQHRHAHPGPRGTRRRV